MSLCSSIANTRNKHGKFRIRLKRTSSFTSRTRNTSFGCRHIWTRYSIKQDGVIWSVFWELFACESHNSVTFNGAVSWGYWIDVRCCGDFVRDFWFKSFFYNVLSTHDYITLMGVLIAVESLITNKIDLSNLVTAIVLCIEESIIAVLWHFINQKDAIV